MRALAKKADKGSNEIKRFTVTIDGDMYHQLQYWSKRRGLTQTEWVQDAITHMIAWENKDYDLPTAEIARLNQLVDAIYNLSSRISSLENVIMNGFKSLLGLTRGDNYLLEEDTVN